MDDTRGQATIEYVGAILLVVAILAGATVAVADPGLPRTVVAKLRLGICIVGGDVCTSEDATARGLEPCLLSTERRQETGGVSFLTFRVGGRDTWQAERRSDGTILLREMGATDVDQTVGLGFKFPGGKVGGDATGRLGFGSGHVWRITQAEFDRLMKRTGGTPQDVTGLDLGKVLGRRPEASFREGAWDLSAELRLTKGDLPSVGVEARATIGRRDGRDGSVTYYIDAGGAPAGEIAEVIPGLQVSGRVGAEWRTSDPPVLTLRMSGSGPGTDTETVMTLPLRTPEDRAAARRVVGLRLPDPTLPWRDLLGRIKDRGTVQRNRFETTSSDDGWDAEVALGLKLGADHHIVTTMRKLVAADILNGPLPARREDCLSRS